MRRIGVLTSGGDSPGMNACIRAVVRYGGARGVQVFGIRSGYQGLIHGEVVELTGPSVSGIIGRGGTILGTARSKEFFSSEGRTTAYETLSRFEIDGLVACGGDGTFQGATLLFEEHGVPVIGTPGTIDNDLFGSDFTIGYDTAINTAVEAIDKIRDTAESHKRTFFIEVMGRHSGFIALDVGIASGAEFIALPETTTNFDDLCAYMHRQSERGRHIFVIAEGDDYGGAQKFADDFRARFDVDTRVTILGHIQRGGAPTARDRILATKLGTAAVSALLDGESGKMAGEVNGETVLVPLRDTWENRAAIDQNLVELLELLQ